MAVVSKLPAPATTIDPDSTSAPGPLSMGSDSPVRSDSSTSRPSAADDPAVGGHLVARAQLHQVAEHDVADRELPWCAVADHRRPRGVQDREAIQGALGPQLLDDADGGVPDDDQAEERVGR